MSSFISPDNTWMLWAIMVGVASISIWLEQNYRWATKATGGVIALLLMMSLTNLELIPPEAPAYDQVWSFIVPMAVPMLLFTCDIRSVWKISGRFFLIFIIGSFGTFLGALLGAWLIGDYVPEIKAFAAMFTGTYIGGSVNFTAMAHTFLQDKSLISAGVVADNFLMALYFFVLIAIPGFKFFKKHYTHPLEDLKDREEPKDQNPAAAYWKAKPIGLKDIAFVISSAVAIVAISKMICAFLGEAIPTGNIVLSVCNQLFSNQYLIITTVTIILVSIFPKFFTTLPGSQEIGTFFIYIFFGVIGAPASIQGIIENSPILFAYAGIVLVTNVIFSFVFGKLFHFNLEEIILASNANIGGPTTAAAMAVSKGWGALVGPSLIVGTFGYVLGNYFGIIAATIVGGM